MTKTLTKNPVAYQVQRALPGLEDLDRFGCHPLGSWLLKLDSYTLARVERAPMLSAFQDSIKISALVYGDAVMPSHVSRKLAHYYAADTATSTEHLSKILLNRLNKHMMNENSKPARDVTNLFGFFLSEQVLHLTESQCHFSG